MNYLENYTNIMKIDIKEPIKENYKIPTREDYQNPELPFIHYG